MNHGHICTPYCTHPKYPMYSPTPGCPGGYQYPPEHVPHYYNSVHSMHGGNTYNSVHQLPPQHVHQMPPQQAMVHHVPAQQPGAVSFLEKRLAELERMVEHKQHQDSHVQRYYGMPGGAMYESPVVDYYPSPYNSNLCGGTPASDIKDFFFHFEWTHRQACRLLITTVNYGLIVGPSFDPFGTVMADDRHNCVVVALCAIRSNVDAWTALTTACTNVTKKKAFLNSLYDVAALYNDIAYHNRRHAMDVCAMLGRILLAIDMHTTHNYNGTYIAITGIRKVYFLVGALAHDVKHPGYSNSFAHALPPVSGQTDLEYMHCTKMEAKLQDFDTHLDHFKTWAKVAIMGTNKATYMAHKDEIALGLAGITGNPTTKLTKQIQAAMHAADVSMYTRLLALAIKQVAPVLWELYMESDVANHLRGAMSYVAPLTVGSVTFKNIGCKAWSGVIAEISPSLLNMTATYPNMVTRPTCAEEVCNGQFGFIMFDVRPTWIRLAKVVEENPLKANVDLGVANTFTNFIHWLGRRKHLATAPTLRGTLLEVANVGITGTTLANVSAHLIRDYNSDT